MAAHSLGAAVQNIMLAAYARGLATGWMCAPLFVRRWSVMRWSCPRLCVTGPDHPGLPRRLAAGTGAAPHGRPRARA